METPAPANDEVLGALARIPLLAGYAVGGLLVERLESLTNRTYRVTLAGQRYVLRIAGPGTGRYIDRNAELHNLRLAAAIGIAPEVLFFDPRDGTMVTRFIDQGVSLDGERMREPTTLRQAAQTLKRLHDSGLRFMGRMELFAKLDEYLSLVRGACRDDAGLRAARARSERLRPAFERDAAAFVPCHIDPAPHNFLVVRSPRRSPSMYLLDWEYAAMCEPVWDLAGLSIEAGFGVAEDRALLAAYFGEPTSAIVARFRLHQPLLRLVAAGWAMAHATEAAAAAPLVAMARRRIAEFHAVMDAIEAAGPIFA
jgi:thiamine kinase-like enzyme